MAFFYLGAGMQLNIKDIKIGERLRKEMGDIRGLADSIKEQGLLQSIGVNENNELIFGLRRIEAAKLLGWEQIDARVVNVTSLIEGEITENEIRKDFTNDEKVAIGEMIEQQLSNRQGQRTDLKQYFDELVPTLAQVKTRDIAAQKAGFGSHGTYEKAKLISEKANDEIKTKLDSNEFSINQAYNEIKKDERKQEIEKQIEQIESGKIKLPKGKYEVIIIDPPWPYGSKYDKNGFRSTSPYPEMLFDEIKDIDLPYSENCVLFLWTTHKFIWDAKKLLDIWNFEYRNILIWDKEKMGIGKLFRMQCEFCLVGIKGKPILNNDNTIRDIIRETRREHSRKPEAFYNMINELCIGRKLDYFAREKRNGFDNFGVIKFEME